MFLVIENLKKVPIVSSWSHGLSLHSNVDNAILHGASEWYERDAFFRTWYLGADIFPFADTSRLLNELHFKPKNGYKVLSYLIGQFRNYHSCMAIIQSESGFIVGLGSAISAEIAAEKALKEVALFHAYWLTYLRGTCISIHFKTFNDHLQWFWLNGGLFSKAITQNKTSFNIKIQPETLSDEFYYNVLWEGKVETTDTAIVRTRVPGLIPQHSIGLFPLRAGNKLKIPKDCPLCKLDGVHPFS